MRIHVHGYKYKRHGKTITVKGYYYERKNQSRKEQPQRATRTTSRQQGRKTGSEKVRSKQAIQSARNEKGRSVSQTRSRTDKRQKPVSIRPHKSKVSISSKGRKRGSTGEAKDVKPQTQFTVKHSRKGQTVKVVFTGSKANRKQATGKEIAKGLAKTVRAQLRRKEGRPPRGLLVMVGDRESLITYISPPELVLNEANVLAFIAKCLQDAKNTPKKSREGKSGENDFEWGGVQTVDLKFIYGSNPLEDIEGENE